MSKSVELLAGSEDSEPIPSGEWRILRSLLSLNSVEMRIIRRCASLPSFIYLLIHSASCRRLFTFADLIPIR